MVLARASRKTKSLVVAFGVVVMLLVSFVMLMSGLLAVQPPVSDLLLSDTEVSSSLKESAQHTGELTSAEIQAAIDIVPDRTGQPASSFRGYKRSWIDQSRAYGVTILGINLMRNRNGARQLQYVSTSTMDGNDTRPLAKPVPNVRGAFHWTGRDANGDYAIAFIVRGTMGVYVIVRGKGKFLTDVADDFASAQAMKLETHLSTNGIVPQKGSSVLDLEAIAGSVLLYLFVVGAIARIRDRTRKRSRSSWQTEFQTMEGVVDVGYAAKVKRRRAAVLSALQVSGLVLVIGALFPDGHWWTRVGSAAAGAAMWGTASWIQRSKRNAGSRSLAWRSLSVFALFYGCFALASAPLMENGGGYWGGCIALGAAGIAHRWRRRVTSMDAERTLQTDTRPMVLFLRSFGDDSNRIRTAVLGRTSLLEKLTPGRFDSFEEVLTRHLTLLGPVVAISPPGTTLAPIGAARALIQGEGWKERVQGWLKDCRLVLICAPPARITEGLLWEMEQVAAVKLWQKVCIVVPPVSDDEVRSRWSQLLECAPPGSPFCVRPPLDPARALVLSFDGLKWRAACASRRTEWTYAAALAEVLGESTLRLSGHATSHVW